MAEKKLIYLDNNATTRIDPRVLDLMMPFLTGDYGNAASSHEFGMAANNAVKRAREQVADLINCSNEELFFTSGATEAINLAIKGIAYQYQNKGKHIITATSEHPAVLDACNFLEKQGFEITYLAVRQNGLLDLDLLASTIRADTILVTIMMVNNETGVIQNIKRIAEIVHTNGSLFMTDATQAIGKIPVDVEELSIDLMSFSAHKFYGPKGIGAIYIRNKKPRRIKVQPLLHGGGQERGVRSGTLNVPGIVGMGAAAELSATEMVKDSQIIGRLRDVLEKRLLLIPQTFINGDLNSRIHSTSNICFMEADADAIMVGMKNILVSNGSACSSVSVEPSHVLKAMGLSDEDAFCSIRFSLGRFTTAEEINEVLETVPQVVSSLRELVS